VYLLRQACLSLAEAHDAGLVHRDLKPRNLYLSRMGVEFDFLKVLDFGLARHGAGAQDSMTQLTAEGMVTGTPAYMSPEAAGGAVDLDARSDLYSLGCVAYWMLAGRTVFERNSPMATLLAHAQTPPTPLSQFRPDVPAPLEKLVMMCLEKEPSRRPPSALDLYGRLERAAVEPPWTNREAVGWWNQHMGPAPASDTTLVQSTSRLL
jgi:serine/threonine-protein kinase